MNSFPFYRQIYAMDCGPSCLRMISRYYNRVVGLEYINQISKLSNNGASLHGLSQAAETLGFDTQGASATLDQLKNSCTLPCIAHWQNQHFVVVYKVNQKFVYVADPAIGLMRYTNKEFQDGFLSPKEAYGKGFLLSLKPTTNFFNNHKPASDKGLWNIIQVHILINRKLWLSLIGTLLIGTVIQLFPPILTQNLVDIGIQNKQSNLVIYILIGQLFLLFGRISADSIRRWVLLNLTTKINLSIVSEFLMKLYNLPLSFYEGRIVGEILRRIEDHSRIERFLTKSIISIFFSLFILIIYSYLLTTYSYKLFITFLLLSFIYIIYIYSFMRKRGSLDQKKFHEASINQNSLIETLYGMTEIKLNGAELWRQHDWKRGQLRLFTINNELGKLSQLQDSGGLLINESKNLIITCMAALSVISGEVSLGMMLAIQFMIGQLNIPINEFITFAREYQDAKISADRIQEVHELPNEEQSNRIELKEKVKNRIAFKSVSFAYQGRNGTEVLSNVNFEIPIGKVTAIVGTSGSGKTTLIKLLLKFYEPSEGLIMIDDLELRNLSTKVWRAKCSVVLQDGFLFSGSVLRNITMNESVVDKDRVTNAAKISNSHSFIEELPEGFETRIGLNGVGLSHGQRQRILLARAIYKESEILILDEATSALDSINEKQIKDNLRQLNPNKTVIIIAHRLSTVLNADNIIVVDKGSIVETGTHSYLFRNQGKYYELINNQLNS